MFTNPKERDDMKKSTRKVTLESQDKFTIFVKEHIKSDVLGSLAHKFGVSIKLNNVGMLVIKGDKVGSAKLQEAFKKLKSLKRAITVDDLQAIVDGKSIASDVSAEMDKDEVGGWNHSFSFKDKRGKIFTITAKTGNQKLLMESIFDNKVVFAGGSAGTGKTFIACAVALDFLEKGLIKKIVITRPHVASEDFGFLPGDIDEKMGPFLYPIYAIFEELIGREKRDEYLQKGLIEILPVAFSRGVTLGGRDGVITIIDESENLTPKQAYLMLTRLGNNINSKIIFAGDEVQTDLKKDSRTLSILKKILKDSPYVGFVDFDSSDVVRSEIVKDIIGRFEEYERSELKAKEEADKLKTKRKTQDP
jgi:phosphate starvation-inducible protein PhoH and related proteins